MKLRNYKMKLRNYKMKLRNYTMKLRKLYGIELGNRVRSHRIRFATQIYIARRNKCDWIIGLSRTDEHSQWGLRLGRLERMVF